MLNRVVIGIGVVWQKSSAIFLEFVDKVSILFLMRNADGRLAQAQVKAFTRQVPILYSILSINTLALVVTYAGKAPLLLSIVAPGILIGACVIRIIVWRRRSRISLSADEAMKSLQSTTWLAGLLGVAFTAWSLSLFPFGDAYARCHVAFFMAITVISCVFCLMHLRNAALLLTFVVTVPFALFFLFTGQPVLVAIALNFVLVTAAMVFILLRNYNDFATLILSQQALLAQQAETAQLSLENFRLANLDALTELPNRRQFVARLDISLANANSKSTRFAVALLDLDGFKGVNDAHGHGIGDRLLSEVGNRLKQLTIASIFIARLGGDEFGAIISGNPLGGGPSDAEILAFGQSVCTLLKAPYLIANICAEISVSVGLAIYPDSGQTAEQLFERADYALYHAKQTRRGEAMLFSPVHETMIRDAARIEQALRQADFNTEIWLEFQPIVDTATWQTVGFEALARWSSPIVGVVRPDIFVPAAERTGLINHLTETLFAKALQTAETWAAPLRISFNLSALDLTSAKTIAALRHTAAESKVAASRIDLEITETAVMRDFDQAAEALASFRDLGMSISLDDFGTGFSSLSHVHRLKPDKIKIDRSFVNGIDASQASQDIIRTVVDLCRNLELACIVEGVETEEQLHVLQRLGCRLMQGYFFSKPLPAAAAARFVPQPGHNSRFHSVSRPNRPIRGLVEPGLARHSR